jgi:hypothetical protein
MPDHCQHIQYVQDMSIIVGEVQYQTNPQALLLYLYNDTQSSMTSCPTTRVANQNMK